MSSICSLSPLYFCFPSLYCSLYFCAAASLSLTLSLSKNVSLSFLTLLDDYERLLDLGFLLFCPRLFSLELFEELLVLLQKHPVLSLFVQELLVVPLLESYYCLLELFNLSRVGWEGLLLPELVEDVEPTRADLLLTYGALHVIVLDL